MILEIVVS
ncbi:hypothetical protein S7711_11439 [Stachybotrys chartarum IBT 7711]|uniref:Uncharacterized protein n=1 Tax=Stachybotrys chartarum (strain CBS 109288 / IBT 7711) TaxID=1280523 RepID=A0A084AXC8_STACB|nr:hypothetical protein S7711_11638 [Stachybotrys chartarum IBT 7711]KEY69957.1 hypothetical protein S7711_11439 [Stachybotrys chartarum IBT 7711]